MINVRQKGKDGELEFVNKYQIFFPDTIKRNLLQTREGGADVSGCAPFQIEIKRCEKIEHSKWWAQVNRALASPEEIPVVAYRANKQPWRFLIPSSLLVAGTDEYAIVSETVFLQFVINTYQK